MQDTQVPLHSSHVCERPGLTNEGSAVPPNRLFRNLFIFRLSSRRYLHKSITMKGEAYQRKKEIHLEYLTDAKKMIKHTLLHLQNLDCYTRRDQ